MLSNNCYILTKHENIQTVQQQQKSYLPFLFWAQCHVEVHLLGAGVVAVVAVAAAAAVAVVVVVDDDGAADAGGDCLVIAAS